MLYLEFLFLLLMIYRSRYGGIGLGVVSGIGLADRSFWFLRMPLGKAPIDVMLVILAVVTCASVLEAAGGLKYMLQIAERILRSNPKRAGRFWTHCDLFDDLYAGNGALRLFCYANYRRYCVKK